MDRVAQIECIARNPVTEGGQLRIRDAIDIRPRRFQQPQNLVEDLGSCALTSPAPIRPAKRSRNVPVNRREQRRDIEELLW